jgi:hypothetical protein
MPSNPYASAISAELPSRDEQLVLLNQSNGSSAH